MSFQPWRPQLMSCDTDRDWEQGAKVKQSTVVSIGSNSKILRERKKERKEGNLNSQHCMLSSKQGKILNLGLHHGSQVSALCHNQKRSMQASYSGAYKNCWFGLQTD